MIDFGLLVDRRGGTRFGKDADLNKHNLRCVSSFLYSYKECLCVINHFAKERHMRENPIRWINQLAYIMGPVAYALKRGGNVLFFCNLAS